MTTVDIVFRYATHPNELEMMALGKAREVYGIRRVNIDRNVQTIRVEYDATRLSGAEVCKILRRAGVSITEEVSLVPEQAAAASAEKSNDPAAAK